MSSRLLVRLAILAMFGPIILFLAAGDLGWTMGWVFAIFAAAYTVLSRLALWRRRPDLIMERMDALKKGNVEPWDRVLVPFLGTYLPVATFILAGLDHRFQGSPEFPLWLQASAYVPMIGGALFAQWAAMENAFFSAVVRIQSDRGQTVVTTGPYRIVRHPGYAGGLLFNLFIPVALGSLWALVPIALNLAGTIVRTALEDDMLRRKLPGYAEYAERTRSRLIPGIW